MPTERGVSSDEKPKGLRCSVHSRFTLCEKCFLRRRFLIYEEAIEYIGNIGRAGSDYGIERMRILLNLLGSPDAKLKFVHVAGTNGKGSVCAFLTAVLKEAGYRVGTYNSPSVFTYNERWRINGEPLGDELVAEYLTAVKNCIDDENARRKQRLGSGQNSLNCYDNLKFSALDAEKSEMLTVGEFNPTAFEIETAAAMLAFCGAGCDIAVLETGLGGRWDATNAVLEKELAVITPIGLDHCALLGDTLGEIASEKAAIIKRDVVTCAQCDEIMEQIRNPFDTVDGERVYRQANVNICGNAVLIKRDTEAQTFEYGGREYKIRLQGKHQLQNAAIAICAVEELRKKGWEISESDLARGLEKAEWSARLEFVKDADSRFAIEVPEGKTLVFDGAHNPHGARALAEAIGEYFGGLKIHLVMGMLADKDVDGVVSLLAPLCKSATAVTPDSPRALDKSLLAEKIGGYAPCGQGGSVGSAVQSALYGDCDVVVLCGSLTLFGDLKQ